MTTYYNINIKYIDYDIFNVIDKKLIDDTNELYTKYLQNQQNEIIDNQLTEYILLYNKWDALFKNNKMTDKYNIYLSKVNDFLIPNITKLLNENLQIKQEYNTPFDVPLIIFVIFFIFLLYYLPINYWN